MKNKDLELYLALNHIGWSARDLETQSAIYDWDKSEWEQRISQIVRNYRIRKRAEDVLISNAKKIAKERFGWKHHYNRTSMTSIQRYIYNKSRIIGGLEPKM